jgi:hypothetical protein
MAPLTHSTAAGTAAGRRTAAGTAADGVLSGLGRGLRRAGFHLALGATVVLAAVAVGLLPVGTWLDQGDEIARSETVLHSVERSTAELSARAEALRTDEEVSRIAREELGMVPAGREAYAITNLRPGRDAISEPPRIDTDPLEGADAAPAPRRSLWRSALDVATFWD